MDVVVRHDERCAWCGETIEAGETACWDDSRRAVVHVRCGRWELRDGAVWVKRSGRSWSVGDVIPLALPEQVVEGMNGEAVDIPSLSGRMYPGWRRVAVRVVEVEDREREGERTSAAKVELADRQSGERLANEFTLEGE